MRPCLVEVVRPLFPLSPTRRPRLAFFLFFSTSHRRPRTSLLPFPSSRAIQLPLLDKFAKDPCDRHTRLLSRPCRRVKNRRGHQNLRSPRPEVNLCMFGEVVAKIGGAVFPRSNKSSCLVVLRAKNSRTLQN